MTTPDFRPWKVDGKRIVYGDSATDVNSESNAALIVRAVNTRDRLRGCLAIIHSVAAENSQKSDDDWAQIAKLAHEALTETT